MQKVGYILFLILILSSCSISRKVESTERTGTLKSKYDEISGTIKGQNLSNNSFYIQKAEVEFSEGGKSDRFIATVKFLMPKEYLISIRSRTGLEIARIWLTKDTILVNDRLNRNLYYGSGNYLERKYGITVDILPLIFGDFIGSELTHNEKENCNNMRANVERVVYGKKIKYTIDCNRNKIIRTVKENGYGSSAFEIEYGDFDREEGGWIPSNVEFNDMTRGINIRLKVIQIFLPWDGEIEFIPGNRYDKIELL